MHQSRDWLINWPQTSRDSQTMSGKPLLIALPKIGRTSKGTKMGYDNQPSDTELGPVTFVGIR